MSKKNYIIPVFVPHLGCSFQCVFCNQRHITGQDVQPDREFVEKKIKNYLATIPTSEGITVEVAFYGGSFTAIPVEKQKELLLPAYKALHEGLIDHIRISTRPDKINEEILGFLMSFGVSIIELGVQSMDDEVLRLSKRGHSKADVLYSVDKIKSWGFDLGLQLMIGLPGDNEKKDIDTARDITLLEPDFVRIYPALVVDGTELAELYRMGEYEPLTLEKAVEVCKKMLLIFEGAKIPVIRIGLQPTSEISEEGEVIAGPFHPAFRELVESAIALDQMKYLLKKVGFKDCDGEVPSQKKTVVFKINPRYESALRGQKNKNIIILKEKYFINDIIIEHDDKIDRGSVILGKIGNKDLNIAVQREELLNNLP